MKKLMALLLTGVMISSIAMTVTAEEKHFYNCHGYRIQTV